MMSMYKSFQTDEDLEQKGIALDYGDFRVTVARAGGSNRRFARTLERLMRPHRRQLQAGTLPNERADAIMREAFVESVILRWEVKDGEAWVDGIEGPNGDVLTADKANITAALAALPDLFQDIQQSANQAALFRAEIMEADAGNSQMSSATV